MTTDAWRWGLAVGLTALWLSLFVRTVWRVRRARIDQARAAAQAGAAGPDAIPVLYASQTGMAEDLARLTAQTLADAGVPAPLLALGAASADTLALQQRALFVVSTTGEGDPADSAARFARTAMGAPADLAELSFGILSLGDSSYRDFCGFGRALEAWLRSSGARPLFDPVEVDDRDPAQIRHWQHELARLTGGRVAGEWTPAPFAEARLRCRRHLNPGSPGGEAWEIMLDPPPGAAWVAGDILEIAVPGGDGQTREYSVASLPPDGALELLVRVMRRPDGTPGLASGWLTQGLALGDPVPVRLRANRAFHGPARDTPLILIGAGAGLAGLAAHLRERALASRRGETWMLFGERTAAHDALHDDRLRAWLAAGVLTRLDRAYSRDDGDGRYVQALVQQQGERLRDWIERGAAIYVCGALVGMAPGVEAALAEVLGADEVQALREAGRYRRDVY